MRLLRTFVHTPGTNTQIAYKNITQMLENSKYSILYVNCAWRVPDVVSIIIRRYQWWYLSPLERGRKDLPMSESVMTAKEACEYLHIGRTTFYRMIEEGRIPPGKKISKRSVRWLRSWIEAVMTGDTDGRKEADVAWSMRRKKEKPCSAKQGFSGHDRVNRLVCLPCRCHYHAQRH